MRRKLTLVVGALLGTLAAGPLVVAPSAATPTSTRPSAAAPATFTHPGVLVGSAQLDFVRVKVNSGAQPWKSAFDAMMASKYASLSRTPKPRAVVECGSYSDPNYGCTDEREDAIAAYTLALAWYITQDSRYAQKSIADHGRLVGRHPGPHQQQRPASDRLGRFLLAPGRRDHQATRTAAGPNVRPLRRPCCATSTSPRSSTAPTATGTGN